MKSKIWLVVLVTVLMGFLIMIYVAATDEDRKSRERMTELRRSMDQTLEESKQVIRETERFLEPYKKEREYQEYIDRWFEQQEQSEVSTTMRKNLEGLNLCYKINAFDSKSPGKVVMKWTITTTGDVKNVAARENQGASEGLVKCLIRNIETWKFPSRESDTEVSYPFSFFSLGFK